MTGIKNWTIQQETGYEPQTTFYTDFSIADVFGGVPAVKDTFKRAFAGWRNNAIYLTELVMVLNWKIWEHYGHDDKLARIYNDLWRYADDYARENLKGDDLAYFYSTTD